MRETTIPIEFMPLDGQVHYIQKKRHDEYSGTCPGCGGTVHQSGEWPDRFTMLTNAKGNHKIYGFCRKCDYDWWPGKHNTDWRPSAEEIAAQAKRAEIALRESIEQAEQAIESLQDARKWIEYHQRLDMQSRMIWNYRGLNDFFIDWWKLGYSQSSCWNSPTITMPIWGHDWEVTNIKHRLLEPNGKGKYRYETSGIPASAFFCDPDRTSGPLFLAEGEIKAMVTFQTLDTPTIQVAGLPSKLPSGNQLDSLKDYDPIYLCPDPDAFRDASVGRICDMLGRERVRVVQLPDKIDDLINAKLIDKSGLRRYVRHAVMA